MKAESERRKGRKEAMHEGKASQEAHSSLILTPLPSLNIVSPSLSSLFVSPLFLFSSHICSLKLLCVACH